MNQQINLPLAVVIIILLLAGFCYMRTGVPFCTMPPPQRFTANRWNGDLDCGRCYFRGCNSLKCGDPACINCAKKNADWYDTHHSPAQWGVQRTDSGATDARPEDATQQFAPLDNKMYNDVPHAVMPGANTMHFGRPGSIYKMALYGGDRLTPNARGNYLNEYPFLRVRLIVDNFSQYHPLVPTFYAVRDLAMKDNRNILFEVAPVDHSLVGVRNLSSVALHDTLPRVVKFRRDGDVIVYDGYTNAGQLYDWVINEEVLNHIQSP
jgi:hypothetical protein